MAIVCFYFVLIGLIKRLNGYRNHGNIYSHNTLYDNKNVCLKFVWWFLYTLLLLKIIFSMKDIICMFGGWGKMCGYLCVYFFKVVKMWKVYKWKKWKNGPSFV